MRILVVGAGALGGYYGARLVAAGRDVTFLVRPRRAAQLKQGLIVKSPAGDIEIAAPKLVQREAPGGPYDLILLGCKAYDLADAMESFAAAVGPQTAILPVLNGMSHLNALDARFGKGAVLGGLCLISSTLDAEGRILHFNDLHLIAFGERDGSRSARAEAIAAAFAGATFDSRLSDVILQEMWEKFAFIASGAGSTCLMRAAIGDIVAAGGAPLVGKLYDECASVAAAAGYPLREPAVARSKAMLTAAGSPITASMLRDIEKGAPVEADHILGDLIRRAGPALPPESMLRIAFIHLKAYEARRAREGRA
jgi:2-dehydropantoate 2-reductase